MTLTKRLTIFFTILSLVLSFTTTNAFAVEIDKARNVIIATGAGFASNNEKDSYEIINKARQAARLDALRQLTEKLQELSGKSTLADSFDPDIIKVKIECKNLKAHFIRGNKLSDDSYYGYEIVMELSIDDPYLSMQNLSNLGQFASVKNSKIDSSVNAAIKSLAVSANIYYYEQNNKVEARNLVNKGIELVKNNYTKDEIEALVNGTNVEIKDVVFEGTSNPIRDLYVIKSDIEDSNPSFYSETNVNTAKDFAIEDIIKNIKYRTDW